MHSSNTLDVLRMNSRLEKLSMICGYRKKYRNFSELRQKLSAYHRLGSRIALL